jgi:hypothetical protein
MKREELKAKGFTDEQIDYVMAEYGKVVEGHKTKLSTVETELDGLKAQLTEASKQIEAFKGMNIDQIKASADEWKTKAEQAEAGRAADRFDHALEAALKEFKVKDPADILPHLKKDALKLNEDGKTFIGLKEQVEPLQASKDYLFASDEQTPVIVKGGTSQSVLGDPFEAAMRRGAQLPTQGK